MLLGFDSIKSTLYNSHQHQKLHHAILLSGKKGIGKASFAKEFAEEIFQSTRGTTEIFQSTRSTTEIFQSTRSATEILGKKISNHPDLLLIEKESEKKEITVDKIRKISEFANQTSAISPYKFIIVDSACELNKSASNALLKILEEPRNNNFLILVAHNLSRVLPTIRSRCQIVKIKDLNREDFTKILQQKKFSAEEINFLSEICDNAPAIAIEMGSEFTQLYRLFLESLKNKKISPELSKKIFDKNFSFVIFEKIFEFFSHRLFKFSVGARMNFFYNEEEIFLKLNQKFPTKKIFTNIEESLIFLHKTTSLNLDKKLCLINIFNRISYD